MSFSTSSNSPEFVNIKQSLEASSRTQYQNDFELFCDLCVMGKDILLEKMDALMSTEDRTAIWDKITEEKEGRSLIANVISGNQHDVLKILLEKFVPEETMEELYDGVADHAAQHALEQKSFALPILLIGSLKDWEKRCDEIVNVVSYTLEGLGKATQVRGQLQDLKAGEGKTQEVHHGTLSVEGGLDGFKLRDVLDLENLFRRVDNKNRTQYVSHNHVEKDDSSKLIASVGFVTELVTEQAAITNDSLENILNNVNETLQKNAAIMEYSDNKPLIDVAKKLFSFGKIDNVKQEIFENALVDQEVKDVLFNGIFKYRHLKNMKPSISPEDQEAIRTNKKSDWSYNSNDPKPDIEPSSSGTLGKRGSSEISVHGC